MVKIDDFHIEFVEKWALYHPGETLNGRIHLKLNDTVLCDAVSITLYGSARVFWVEREPQGNVTFSSEKIYFNDKQQVWTYQSGTTKENPTTKTQETRPHLPAGSHEFTFSYVLPSELPTSFDAKHSSGYVRYFAKVCIMNQESIKHSRKAYFSVVKHEDLNMYPSLYSSSTRQNVKRCTSRFCFKSDLNRYVSLSVNLPKLGFVPGEQIKFSVEIDNRGERSIRALKAHLIQQVTAYANSPSFKMQDSVKTVVSVGKMDKLRKGGVAIWDDTPLYIPAVVPTFVIDDILEVHYSLKIDAYCDKHGAEIAVEIPITVGTVPLCNANNLGLVPRGTDPPPAYDNYSMNIPPPSYEESVTGTNSTENEDPFVPRYAVYAFS